MDLGDVDYGKLRDESWWILGERESGVIPVVSACLTLWSCVTEKPEMPCGWLSLTVRWNQNGGLAGCSVPKKFERLDFVALLDLTADRGLLASPYSLRVSHLFR